MKIPKHPSSPRRPLFSSLLPMMAAVVALSAMVPTTTRAQDEDEPIPEEFRELTADQIVELVRLSQALQNHDLSARLRKKRELIPLGISMRRGGIFFKFREPDEIIQLQLSDDKSTLNLETPAGKKAIPAADYGKAIRGTDVTYEDLSMRFLYWPKPAMVREERVGFKKCWKLRIQNPDKTGPYRMVLVWVHQASGALLQIEGYGWDNAAEPVKKFRVTQVQKVDGTWILKQMKVETINSKTGRSVGDTFLEVRKPKAAK